MAIEAPYIALMGGGYTLTKVAQRLKPGSFVITSRSAAQCAEWQALGWVSHRLSLEESESVVSFFKAYPELTVLVDSVPPLREAVDRTIGVKRVVHALATTKITRVIYLSTTGVFGVRDGSIVDESTVPAPWNPQGEARYLSELAYRSSGKMVTALRLPAIYGPGRSMVDSVINGTYRMVGDGDSWSNRIHVEDLVSIIISAVEALELPEVLCVSDDHPARVRDVLSFICAREGVPFPAFISEQEALRAGSYTRLSNQIIKNDLMKKLLAITLRYPSYREGL